MKPKYLYAIAFIIFLVPAYFQFAKKDASAVLSVGPSEVWETKIDDQPPVVVAVTPLELEASGNSWKFDISLETHSEELDYDLTEKVFLEDEKGGMVKAVAWEGPLPSGHHVNGTLVFSPIAKAKEVVMRVKGIGGIEERVFSWEVR